MAVSALERQKKRLKLLKDKGIERTSILVHENCRPIFETIKPHLINPDCSILLSKISELSPDKSSGAISHKINQLSPFRYPGGKSWLVPEITSFINNQGNKVSKFIEPFAGGANISLNVASAGLADKVVMSELDREVAAVWNILIKGSPTEINWLCKKISSFIVNAENVNAVLQTRPRKDETVAFKTIIKNRMHRGGILADGAGLLKQGENGRGLLSRWYPETLVKRIENIQLIRDRISFEHTDGFKIIRKYSKDTNAFFFVDPPYTAGGKNAGKRLYRHSLVDHERLFGELKNVLGRVVMTYDDTEEVRQLANSFGFSIKTIAMKNTHHKIMKEILVFN